MKSMVFVSTGRCGTLRLSQILGQYLPDSFFVAHQLPKSRLINIIGNLTYDWKTADRIRRQCFRWLLSDCPTDGYLVLTDPLSSMMIPDCWVYSSDVAIVHITREPLAFGRSIYRLSRSRWKSWIGHIIVPFWQPGLLPMENLIRNDIIQRYAHIGKWKNGYLEKRYGANPNYRKMKMADIFGTDIVSRLINDFFGFKMAVPDSEWSVRAN
jgi:hypothetical protein